MRKSREGSKKTSLESRGSYEVKIKTINGSFTFAVNRYMTSSGSSNWLRLTDKALSAHHESQMLQEFSLRYATLMSYERVSSLVQERCGTTKLSDQRIHHLVQEKAEEMLSLALVTANLHSYSADRTKYLQ